MSDDLEQQVRDIKQLLHGNGEEGLVREHRRIMRDLYVDPQTGEPGLIADVRQVKKSVGDLGKDYQNDRNYVRGAVNLLAFLVGTGTLAGLAAVIYNIAQGGG